MRALTIKRAFLSRRLLLASAAAALAGCGGAQTPTAPQNTQAPAAPQAAPAPVDLRAEAEAAVRKSAIEWGQIIVMRDLDRMLNYYADDAWVSPQGAQIAKTADERRMVWAKFFAQPGVMDTAGETTRVEVAQSGDLAIQYGTFQETVQMKKGKASTVSEKYMTTWRKQTDGSWKVIGDIWNRDN